MPLTLATLALFTAVIVVLRIRWPRLSSKLKRFLILFGLVPVALLLFAAATRLSTTSDHLNTIVWWGSALGYIFIVSLFTLLRPVWLTSLVAIILILPLLSASAIFPLAAIFSRQTHHIEILGDGLVSDLVPIDAITPGASGADITIYRPFSWAPFFRRKEQGARYFNTQCDSSAAYAVLQPDHYHLRMVCPAAPGAPPANGHDLIVNLYSH
jgi:hypothetical protein